MNANNHNVQHYDKNYFSWQSTIGEFGGWANMSKFENYIKPEDTVLDFGCGGGDLLKNIYCSKKVGVEINPVAAAVEKENRIEVFMNLNYVPVIL